MSRARRLAAIGLIAAAAISLSGAPHSGAPGTARADSCVWTKHVKRVVKRIKRHGKVRRVVRKRVRWTCDPVGTATDPGSGSTSPSNPPPAAPAYLGVRAQEYSYVLSRPDVPGGQVTIELDNFGQDPHDLNVAPAGSGSPIGSIPLTASGSHSKETFTLAPGTYKLWCDLPGHDALGMHATLVVGP